ncbi:MAG: DUF3078 domain-containing protein [Bacteroidales bacterium]|nr:DUF3078 domain-containing protein [Bacteroidales bacterium]
MNYRLLLSLVLSCFLISMRAQEVDVTLSDSLVQKEILVEEPDSSLQMSLDSLEMNPDSLEWENEGVLRELETLEAIPDSSGWKMSEQSLLRSWQHYSPFQPSSEEALMVAELDSLNRSALSQRLDSLPADPTLSYAQNDLRLPIIMDGRIPKPESMTIADVLKRQERKEALPACLTFANPYKRQLSYGAMLHRAVHNYSSHHLNRVAMFRNDQLDLPFERRRIQRQRVQADEQVETGLGLQLDDAGLNIEQITFHADKWHRKGTTDLQISQTALSDNWYKGGDNNMTLSTYDKLVLSRYDESKVTSLDIAIELRLSGYYTKADTVHPMRVNDNSFRIDVSYGYKAWKNWYYSTSAYMKTPLFEYFNANSKKVKSTFLSPVECNVSIGMDLKLTNNKKYTYSLLLAPLSYNLKYVHDDRVPVTSYGIEAGKRSLNQFGATVTSKLEWAISNSVSWSSRAYYFTSYHSVQVEFENTFNVKLGHYCTSKFYIYPRFDDSVDHKVQMKETVTVGLAFVW